MPLACATGKVCRTIPFLLHVSSIQVVNQNVAARCVRNTHFTAIGGTPSHALATPYTLAYADTCGSRARGLCGLPGGQEVGGSSPPSPISTPLVFQGLRSRPRAVGLGGGDFHVISKMDLGGYSGS